MDTQRLILFFVFGFSVLMLWDAWEKEHRPKPAAVAAQQAVPSSVPASPPERKAASATAVAAPSDGRVPEASPAALKGEAIVVRTDLVVAEIDTVGATLRRLDLLKHKEEKDGDKSLTLLGPDHRYEAQSGLTGDSGLNHRTLWTAQPGERELAGGQATLEVKFSAHGPDGLAAVKTYRFHRDSYQIDVTIEVSNAGAKAVAPAAYFQLTHDGKPSGNSNAVASTFGAQSFNGFAVYTDEKKFQKVHHADVDKNKADFVKESSDGWLAYVQHYFVAGWIPPAKAARSYEILKRDDGVYAGYVRVPLGNVEPGKSVSITVPMYAGPQEQHRLAAVAPGFDLVVDYGWLTVIAWPLFWLLEKFHHLAGNWGLAIILLTVTIKLIFYPLSAAQYRSMAKMKLVTPRIQKIREMYENDRQKMNLAMMELYKTEKINPLGGCFPILVQIPVFIALYWVLLAAIELRHAPFFLWIHDLSAQDPFYVLPILMTVTMVLQTRMNPAPPDPVQAKVMQFMPFIFSIFFFFFPAGLVLYWLVNNVLSILQQWQNQRMFDRDRPAHAKR
jgi:YidC/Oxa1 family membrane protein insertase